MSASSGAPDLTEAVLGFRVWELRADGALGAMLAGGVWVPGVNEAICSPHLRPSRRPRHSSPHRGCSCGFNAYFAISRRLLAGESAALGAIAAWGEIDVYRSGFRAQFAQVIALSFPADGEGASRTAIARLQRARDRYDVPLVPRRKLRAEALRFASPLSDALLPEGQRKRQAPTRRPVVSVVSWNRARGLSIWVRRHVALRAHEDGVELGPAPGASALADPDPEVRVLPLRSRVEAGTCVATIAAAYPGRTIHLLAPVGGEVAAHNPGFGELLRDGDRAVSAAPWLLRLSPDDAPLEDAPTLWGRPGVELYQRSVARLSDAGVLADLAPPTGFDPAALVPLAGNREPAPSLAAHQRMTTALPPQRGRRAAIMVEHLRPLLLACDQGGALLAA